MGVVEPGARHLDQGSLALKAPLKLTELCNIYNDIYCFS